MSAISEPGFATAPAVLPRAWRIAALILICALAAWCYAPGLRGYFVQDDFAFVALSRLLHQPWLVFYSDHFPGSLFFRPLGIFLWWLTVAAFDNATYPQFVVNLALHLAVVFALYVLLQRLRPNAWLNLFWTALYAIHPLTIGTALWLSDRFDLLATLFSLLALNFALVYLSRPRGRVLCAMLASLLLALMGKEIGVVGAAATFALIALPDGSARLSRAQRMIALAAIAVLTFAWLVYRHVLMADPQNVLLTSLPLTTLFGHGTLLWLRIGFEFLAMDPRQQTWAAVVLAFGAALLAIAVVMAVRTHGWRPRSYGLAAAVLILLLLPGPTQAPVVYFSSADLDATTFWFNMIGGSRLYHMSLAGAVIGLALLTAPAAATTRDMTRVGWITAMALLLMVLAWAPASHRVAHDFAKNSRLQMPPLQAANAAIARLNLPAHRCQIYLLNGQSIWGLGDNGDATVKASAPQLGRLGDCLILTERTPWGNYVRTGSIGAQDYAPLRPLTYEGQLHPWLALGDFQAAYLNLDADIDARAIDGAFFLEYRDGAFVDVSAAVRSGERPVHFFNARPNEH
jgi:hypothetical protein